MSAVGEWVKQSNGKWSNDWADSAFKDNIELLSAQHESPTTYNLDTENVERGEDQLSTFNSPLEKSKLSNNDSIHTENDTDVIVNSILMERLSMLART